METHYIISQLEYNKKTFEALLQGVPKDLQNWIQQPGKWNLLEIVCHLYDEEREDFRARVKLVLENPEKPFVSIDPIGWVTERKYKEQNYNQKLHDFLTERSASISWLSQLGDAPWDNVLHHPTIGDISAYRFLASWLAHDYLHFRQITKIKYDYLQNVSGQDLSYAGGW